MKLRVTFKDPDGCGDSIDEAVRNSLPADLDADEAEAVFEERRDKIKAKLSQWIEYGEYLAVDFDTDAGTAVVVRRR